MADITSLAAELKETRRLLKNLDEFTLDIHRSLSEDVIANKNNLKALEKKVTDLEKKQKK